MLQYIVVDHSVSPRGLGDSKVPELHNPAPSQEDVEGLPWRRRIFAG